MMPSGYAEIRRPLVALALLAGCGGGGLRYVVDDGAIARASVAERAGVLAAQDDVNEAQKEQSKAVGDVAEGESKRAAADAELKRASEANQQAAAAQKAADQANDINLLNHANRDKLVSDAALRAAEGKVEWLRVRQKALLLAKLAADRRVACAQARYELEKAKVAQAKGWKPSSDFELAHFESQAQETDRAYQAAKNDADARAAEASDVEKLWNDSLKQLGEMKGGH
jgi:hypothetical protein